jgi:hypothetical protein
MGHHFLFSDSKGLSFMTLTDKEEGDEYYSVIGKRRNFLASIYKN